MSVKNRTLLIGEGLLHRGAAPPPPPPATGAFTLSGHQIIDPDGALFIPRGVNVNGPHWVWTGSTVADIDYITTYWGFNLIRLNSLVLSGTPGANEDIAAIVAAFTARKVVCMFEAHDKTGSLFSGSELTTLKAWLQGIAQVHGNNPYVWYDIMNEPDGHEAPGAPSPSPGWVTMHADVISNQRNYTDSMIIAEGSSWAQDTATYSAGNVPTTNSAILDKWDDLKAAVGSTKNHNLIASIHNYEQWNAKGVAGLTDFIDRVQALGIPLLIGEVGGINNGFSTAAATDAAYAVALGKGVGVCPWSWTGQGAAENALCNTGSPPSGRNINSTTSPTNLTHLGGQAWTANH